MRLRSMAGGVALLMAAAGSASAGEIKGGVADVTGGALPGARVVLENLATRAETVTAADSAGRYAFASLGAGQYLVAASLTGFSAQARSVRLEAESASVEVNFSLAVGTLQSGVTVTATRGARDSLLVPQRAESLGQQQLAATNPASSGELLIEAPGITPVANGPFQTRPRLRGLDSTRVLVLVDGERLNNARTATDRAGVEVGLVDASSIDSIEVVSGGGSVLYGTDALSGTINILTAQPSFSDAPRFTAGLNGYFSTNESGRRGNVGVGVSAKKYAIGVSGGLETFDNYSSGGEDGSVLEDSRPLYASGILKQADTIDTNFPPFVFQAFPDPFNAPFARRATEIPASSFEGETVNANALFALGDKQNLRFKYFHRKAEDIGFPDFVPPQFFQRIVLPFSELDKASARYQVRQLTSRWSSLTATAYFQRQDRKLQNIDIPVQFPAPTAVAFFPINVFRLMINSDTRQQVETAGLDVQNTYLLSPKNVLTAGFTVYQDKSEDERNSSSQLTLLGQVALGARGPAAVVLPSPQPLGPPTLTKPVRVPNATFRDLGVYVQDEWDVSEKVRLVAGVRLDSYKVESDPTAGYDIQGVIAGARPAINPATLPNPSGDSTSRTALTGDVGAVVKANEKLSLVAHYGRSYRHPNLEELLFAGPATIGSIAPNITVEPETGDNFDLGLKFRAAKVAGSLSFFHNTYKGFISTEITGLTAGSSVSQAINFAKVRIQGFEANLEAPLSAGSAIVTLLGNGAYNKGDVREGRNPLTGASIGGTPQDNITPLKLIAGARLSDRRNRFWLEYSLRHQKEVERVAVTLRQSPFLIYQDLAALDGFTVQRVGAGFDWKREGYSVGVTVNLENLANKFYREHYQFAPARGRSATFGLRLRRL